MDKKNLTTYFADYETQSTKPKREIDENCILLFIMKGERGITENNWCISLRFMMSWFSIVSNPKSKKFLEKNQNGFRRNRSTTSQSFDNTSNHRKNTINLRTILVFENFFRTFNSIQRGKMEKYNFPKKLLRL